MPNDFFKFKQFTVFQDKCAMKVGTDGVLLGAWCNIDSKRNALDVGTGTGLVALMIAQRNPDLFVDALEIDYAAACQAQGNFSASPFSSRIDCLCNSLQDFGLKTLKKYDLIVSNPPYFKNSMKTHLLNRTQARHDDSLPLDELFWFSAQLLSDEGVFSLVYPSVDEDLLMSYAQQNELYLSRITRVLPTATSLPKRVLVEFSKNKSVVAEDELIIELERHKYTDQFKELTREFYL